MRITTKGGIELSLTREELTVLRRNVALGYEKKRTITSDGEIKIESDRRPHWSSFQQRLISPGDREFILKNPLDDVELSQVVARCVKNLGKAEEGLEYSQLLAYCDKTSYTRGERIELLALCEEISFLASKIIEEGKNFLVLAYCDLHVIMFEIDGYFTGEFNERQARLRKPSKMAGG